MKKDNVNVYDVQKILSERIERSEKERAKKIEAATTGIVYMLVDMAQTIDLDRIDCLRLQISDSHLWWQKFINNTEDLDDIIKELKERGFQAAKQTEGLLEVWL